MRLSKRARSDAAKLERKDNILASAEILLRQVGVEAMTMQSVAMSTGIAKGTLYLYFASREELILYVYDQLHDKWVERLASNQIELTGVDDFCRVFVKHYKEDPLLLQLTCIASASLDLSISIGAYIVTKRAMARRVKRLAGLCCNWFSITPVVAQKMVWGLLTVAVGASQMTIGRSFARANLPRDVVAFAELANFESIFLNAAIPMSAGIVRC